MKSFLCFLLGCMFVLPAFSQLKTAGIFGNHMVIQRNKPIRIWGWAPAGEQVTVEFAGKKANAKTGRNGSWELVFPSMSHGGPYTMIIRGKTEIRFEDILVGEVWLCSGQSNMEWPLNSTDSAEDEIARAHHPQIRHIKIPRRTSLQPEQDIQPASWEVCSPGTAGNFTAVGYYFALKIQASLGVPVGLINSSWGGTHVETWTSSEAFFAQPDFAGQQSKMPRSADSILQQKKDRTNALIRQIQGSLPAPEEALQYRDKTNDADWKSMELPAAWEFRGMPEFDGVVWFRKTFQLPADLPIANPVLYLAMIDDEDSTFINGRYIGSEIAYNKPRIYRIPQGLLKQVNTIAVKIKDGGGDGGIHGSAADMYVKIQDTKIPLSGPWKYRIESVIEGNQGIHPNAYPTLLYNAMIHPLVRFPIGGAIWYQGESNAGRAAQYRTSFPAMITDWRTRWKDAFPFYFVQLTHWKAGGGNSRNGGSSWAELREAQEHALRLPHTGMAVITDIGNTEDIHPRNKKDVGDRLARQALNYTYQVSMPCESPLFESMTRSGNQVILHFKNLYGGWEVRNPYGYINGFELAGADQRFYLARARISGDKIIVESDDVKEPVAARYCWSDDPNDVNLFNKAGLPARPFRTDDWPMKTSGAGFRLDGQ